MSNEVTLRFSDTTVTLKSVGGSSASDVSAAITTHNALATGVHGVGASTVDSVAARNAAIAAIYGEAGAWTTGQSFRAETVYQKAALATGSFTAFSIDPQDTGARDWNFNIGTNTFAGDPTRPDVVLNWGYNNGFAGQDDVSDDSLYLQIESYYASSATARMMEYHLNYFGENGTPNFRPFQININRHDDATVNGPAYTHQTWIGDKFEWFNRRSSDQIMIITGSDTVANSAINFKAPVYTDDVLIVGGGKSIGVRNSGQTVSLDFFSDTAGHIAAGGSYGLSVDNWSYIVMPDFSVLNTLTTTWNLNSGINLVTGKYYMINSVQVVGARVIDARCDDAVNSGDATTDGVIDALRDAMIAHGLIAAA